MYAQGGGDRLSTPSEPARDMSISTLVLHRYILNCTRESQHTNVTCQQESVPRCPHAACHTASMATNIQASLKNVSVNTS